MHQQCFLWLPVLIIAVNCPSNSATDIIQSLVAQPKTAHEELTQKESGDNYNRKIDGKISISSESPPLLSPSSSATSINDERNIPANFDRQNHQRRQHRCLVEAILYRHTPTADGHGRKKDRSVSAHVAEPQLQPQRHVHSRAKRSERTARPYFTAPTGDVALVELPGQHIDGKILFAIGPFGPYRPLWYSPDGLKIWGAGSESKFPPLFEYLVQRVQAYYSVYKYEDLSRPGIEWATTIKPDPKPLPDDVAATNELEENAAPVPDVVFN